MTVTVTDARSVASVFESRWVGATSHVFLSPSSLTSTRTRPGRSGPGRGAGLGLDSELAFESES
jgi:hypothetical protein